MVEPTLALQKLLRARLLASPDIVAIVNPDDIGDIGSLPTTFPCINIAEANAEYSDNVNRFHERAHATLHIWTAETKLQSVKVIAGHVRAALKQAPWTVEGHICHGITLSDARFLRDPSGEHGHAILTVDAILQTKAAA